MTDVDCMSCLVNVARGLIVEDDEQIQWQEVIHAVVWEMGPGRVAIACRYELINIYGGRFEWRTRE